LSALGYVEIEVEIGQCAFVSGHKFLAWQREHRIENPVIGDVGGMHLTVDHFLTRGRKIGHRLTRCGGEAKASEGGMFGATSGKTQHPPCGKICLKRPTSRRCSMAGRSIAPPHTDWTLRGQGQAAPRMRRRSSPGKSGGTIGAPARSDRAGLRPAK